MNEIPEYFDWLFGRLYQVYLHELNRLEALRRAKVVPTVHLNFNRPVARPMRSVNRNR